jgi:hypothetical protein
MSLEVWAVQTAVDTSGTGTTDFAHGTVTTTPIAALHCFSNATANATPKNQGLIAFGMSDGTDDRYASIGIQHNVATSNTVRNHGTTGCVTSCFATGSGIDGSMGHNSFISGGQRLDNDNGFAAANLCNSLFFNCDNAKVMTATLNATVDTVVNIDPGFAWDAVIFFGIPQAAGAGDGAEIYFGFFDGTNQGSIQFNSQDADATPGDPTLRISDTYVGGELDLNGTGVDYQIDVAAGTGTSLDLWPRTAGGDSDPVYCLFLSTGGTEGIELVSWDSPIANGSSSVATASFEPQSCIHLLSFAAAYDVSEIDGDAGSWGVTFETADDQLCASIQDEDATGANSDVQSIVDNTSIFVEEDDGSSGYAAAFTSYNSDGWTHNWTAQDGSVNKFISLAFEVEAGASTVAPRKATERLMRNL